MYIILIKLNNLNEKISIFKNYKIKIMKDDHARIISCWTFHRRLTLVKFIDVN